MAKSAKRIFMVAVLMAIAAGCTSKASVLTSVNPEPTATPSPSPAIEHVQELEFQGMPYLLSVPADYDAKADKKWPLIMFLHGYGMNEEYLRNLGIITAVDQLAQPFITITPITTKGFWQSDEDKLVGMLDEVAQHYRVDKSKMYLTGESMGGFETWDLPAAHPGIFAAIAPIENGGDVTLAPKLVDVPIWAFHNKLDTIISWETTEKMVNAVKDAGGKEVLFTIHDQTGHDGYTKTFHDPQFFEWLLKHSLKK